MKQDRTCFVWTKDDFTCNNPPADERRKSAAQRDAIERVRMDLSSDICKARNEYDDERDGDFDDYLAGRVLRSLGMATIQADDLAAEARALSALTAVPTEPEGGR